MGKHTERVFKKIHWSWTQPLTMPAGTLIADGFLEYSPSRGSLYYKAPALQKIILVVLGSPLIDVFQRWATWKESGLQPLKRDKKTTWKDKRAQQSECIWNRSPEMEAEWEAAAGKIKPRCLCQKIFQEVSKASRRERSSTTQLPTQKA